MFAGSELAKLEQTKRLLTTQADIHRHIICMEVADWSGRLARLQKIRESFTTYRGLLMAATAGAGLFAAKRGRSIFRWIPLALGAWRTVRQFLR